MGQFAMPERLWISHRLSDLGRRKSELAAALSLDPARVTEIINGKRAVHIDEIAPMARLLEMTEMAVYCQLVGSDIPDGLSPDERALLDKYRRVMDGGKRAAHSVLDAMAEPDGPPISRFMA